MVVALALGGLLFLLLIHPPGEPFSAALTGLALTVASFACAGSAVMRSGRGSELLLVSALSAMLFHDALGTAADYFGGVRGTGFYGLLALRALLALAAFVAVGRARPFSAAP